MPYKDINKRRESARKRYLKNKESESARKKDYYLKNKATFLSKQSEYYSDNKEKVLNYSKDYYIKNKDVISKKAKLRDNKKVTDLEKSYVYQKIRVSSGLSNELIEKDSSLIKIQEIKIKLHRLIKSKKNGNK